MSFMRAYQGRRGVIGGMAASLVAAAVPAGEVLAQGMAERIFLARAIHTVDDAQRSVQAVAVRGGRIVALGARDEVLGLRGARTEVVDFGDATVLPGFVEPHMHSNFAGLRPWLDVGPFTTADMDAARGKIRAAAAQAGPGGWVQAKMLDPSIMQGRPFDRASLDDVSPEVPVFALEANGHVAYVNSKAIALAGVSRDTPDPPQARFVRDAGGALSGRLEEPNAFQPFVSVMPSPAPAELAALLRADLDDASAKGCTTLHDCGIGGLFGEGDLALLDAVMAGDPGVRYAGFLVSTHFETWAKLGLRPGERSRRFTLNGIKAWADGSNQGLTGYQREPYLGTTNRGALNYTPAEIEQVIRQAHDAGWQIGVHANGDAAIDVVLEAFERATDAEGRRRLRHRIEHCSILDTGQIARMARLGISPSFLIGHVHFWGRAFRDRLLGPERADRLDPCRSALAGGLRISLHSDYNVTPVDPLRCIENAVLRDMHEGGGVLNPNERISVMHGIRAMTIDAAWQCHLDHLCGSLEVGKAADMVVLERDPLAVRADEIRKIPIRSTWLDGERRFSA
ncbi:MAG: amidohydrolase [Alphaproteobacteria bacterium]|nr:amidohydrolase [Alphaproteobacteria bacterium]